MRERITYALAPIVVLVLTAVILIWIRQRPPGIKDILTSYTEHSDRSGITIVYPQNGTLFPPEIVAPTFRWEDENRDADIWLVRLEFGEAQTPVNHLTRQQRWTPGPQEWESIKRHSLERDARVLVLGVKSGRRAEVVSAATTTIRTSKDAVGAPLFYREVNLPFIDAVTDPTRIRWRFGSISSPRQPPVVLQNLPVCGNCHSFTQDGRTLAMDVDYANSKGSYVITPVKREMVLATSDIITWNDYRKEDGEQTFGLLSQMSPDGRYVLSTVKDKSVFVPMPDLAFSQLFFPIKGILCVYDRQTQVFSTLPGADDPGYVQSNPSWSPDGEYVVFARAKAYDLRHTRGQGKVLLTREECKEFVEDGKPFLFDLYRVPFNDGRGGVPEPIPGASHNGMSNYFARYSPDGRWIVFCKAKSYMLLQRDSELYIIPAQGGTARRLRGNTGRMNSWHSWSPNGRWLVFASKAAGPFTQLWLTHIDADGNDSPAVLLEHFTAADRAANIPEFVNVNPGQFREIREAFADYYTHYRIGVGLERRHEYAKAIAEFQMALAEQPNHAESLYLLASCLARLHREQEAMSYARKAAALAPNSQLIHSLLGGLYSSLGQYGDGLAYLELAHAANPGDVAVANNLAWLLATCPEPRYRNGPRALRLARQACEATAHKSPPLLDSLAAAYAETGQFDQAVATTRQALEIVRSNPKASTETLESRLKLYEAGQPYRDAPPK